MSNSPGEISSHINIDTPHQSHTASIENSESKYASDASISTQPMVLPPRSTLMSVVLVFTVTFATIINVRRATVTGRKRIFFEPIIIDCKFFINCNNYTNNSERAGLRNSPTPVDRILLSFKCGMSQLSRVKLPKSFRQSIYPNSLGLSAARLRKSCGCIWKEKGVYIWNCRLGGIYLSVRVLKKWAKITSQDMF